MITKHWKDETKGHPNDVQENCGDERDKKVATTDTHNTDLTGHEKVKPVKDMKEDAHFGGNIAKIPAYSNYMKNSESKSGTIGSKDKFLWSPDAKETMTELEIGFNSQDFRTEFDKVEDTIYNDDTLIEIVFNIKILPQGKGLKSLFDSDQESDNECTELKTIVSHHNNDDKKELDGKVTLVIGKREDGKVDVLNSY